MAHIMLETSGMASPYPTARLLRNEGECRATNSLAQRSGRRAGRPLSDGHTFGAGLRDLVHLDLIVCVIDSAFFSAEHFGAREALEQARPALARTRTQTHARPRTDARTRTR